MARVGQALIDVEIEGNVEEPERMFFMRSNVLIEIPYQL